MNTNQLSAAVLALLAGSALSGQAMAQSTEPFPAQFQLSSLLPANGGNGTNGFVLNGIAPYDQSGRSVSSAGDVNGDGINDLIIGAQYADPNGNSAAGQSYVVFGSAGVGSGGAIELASLNGTNGFVLNGIDASDASGRSVSSAGDVNGNGFDDLIIGALRADPNGNSSAGESYVVFGGPGVGVGGVLNLSSLNGSNGFVLNGISTGDQSGGPVSSAGDVNGDGIDDLIIAAEAAGPNGVSNAGESYVVFGAVGIGAGGSVELSSLNGTNGFVLSGIDPYDQSGRSVSSAGDVNGDGIDDLIVGAALAGPNGNNKAGESYVVFGGPGVGVGGVQDLSSFNGSNGFVINGIGNNDLSGGSVSSAGDVNGDGIDDLIIGAIGGDPNGLSYAGESYVVFGGPGVGTGGVLNLSTLNGSNGFVLNGIDANDFSGRSVTSAGDVNGDGIDDLFIGAEEADPNGKNNAGESYVVFGGPGVGTGGVLNLSSLNGTTGFVLNGIDADDESGLSVSSAGDVNSDGFDDLIIGAQFADPNGNSSAGESYVVFGRALQAWNRSGGGAFENGPNWLLGSSPTVGVVGIEPEFGGTVTLSQPVDLFLTRLTIGSQLGVATLNIGPSSLLGVDEPLGLPASAAIAGSGILVAQAGVMNSGVVSGPDLMVVSATGLTNQGVIDVDGRASVAVSRVRVIGPLTNEPGGEVLLRQGAVDLVAESIANGGEIAVAFADAAVAGPFTNEGSYSSPSGFVVNGIAAGDESGRSVSSAGDVNGDGIDDLIIGAIYADPNGNSAAGQSYVVFGSAGVGSAGVIELASLNGTNGFVLNGIGAYDLSGGSVSSAGDVNGDGIDDLIIGALYADPNGNSSAGESYVVFGSVGVGSTGVIELSSLNGTTGFVINGVDVSDQSGFSVSSAGDVNGDGIDDLLIGAPGEYESNATGESYVVFGAVGLGSAGAVDLSSLNGSNGFVLYGIDTSDRSGYSVSSAGDVNGDGTDDLIIGASEANPNGISDAGESYVVFGNVGVGSAGSINLSSLNGTNGFVLNGIDVFDLSGGSVASAGDVNGDGIADLIIGASGGNPNANSYAGESYVVFGGVGLGSTGLIDLASLTGPNGFVLNGADANDNSGRSVSSAGDVNGDGYDDLLIGAYLADPNGNFSGESYVVFGGASVGSTGSMNLSSLNGSNGFVFNGIDSSDFSGRSVSSAGDVNGDGADDLIIGARSADPNGNNAAGESYVVFGRSASDDPFPAVIELSELASTFETIVPGLITTASSSQLLFDGNVSNPGTIVLNADSAISILGSLSGNGVDGPSGPGSAGPVFAFDGIFPGPPVAGLATRGLAPASAGIMRFDGDLDLGPSAHTIIEIGGATPGVNMDQLSSALNLGVGGTLEVQLVNGYTPQPGDIYPVLDFASASGNFSSIVLDPGLIAAGANTDALLLDGTITLLAPCPADTNGDGILDNGDIGFFVGLFLAGNLAADFNGDGILDNGDIGAFVAAFLAGCP